MSQPTAEDRMDRAALALVILILVCCAIFGAMIYSGIAFLNRSLDRNDAQSFTPQARHSTMWGVVPLRAPARPAE